MHDGVSRSPLLMRVSQSLWHGLRPTIAITRSVTGNLVTASFRSPQRRQRSSPTRSTELILLSVVSFWACENIPGHTVNDEQLILKRASPFW